MEVTELLADLGPEIGPSVRLVLGLLENRWICVPRRAGEASWAGVVEPHLYQAFFDGARKSARCGVVNVRVDPRGGVELEQDVRGFKRVTSLCVPFGVAPYRSSRCFQRTWRAQLEQSCRRLGGACPGFQPSELLWGGAGLDLYYVSGETSFSMFSFPESVEQDATF